MKKGMVLALIGLIAGPLYADDAFDVEKATESADSIASIEYSVRISHDEEYDLDTWRDAVTEAANTVNKAQRYEENKDKEDDDGLVDAILRSLESVHRCSGENNGIRGEISISLQDAKRSQDVSETKRRCSCSCSSCRTCAACTCCRSAEGDTEMSEETTRKCSCSCSSCRTCSSCSSCCRSIEKTETEEVVSEEATKSCCSKCNCTSCASCTCGCRSIEDAEGMDHACDGACPTGDE